MFRQAFRQALRPSVRMYSSAADAPAPPMLQKIRADLKTAMRAKDTQKLAVLRALLAHTLNASKTSSPIVTDMQVLSLIKKNMAASRDAAEQFRAQNRPDLAEKEEGQVKVYEEYAGGVEVLGVEDITKAVQSVIDAAKAEAADKKVQMGDVLKKVFSPEALGGKNVEKSEVARIVKELLGAK